MPRPSSADHPLAAAQDEALRQLVAEALWIISLNDPAGVVTIPVNPINADGLFEGSRWSGPAAELEIIRIALRRAGGKPGRDKPAAFIAYANGGAALMRHGVKARKVDGPSFEVLAIGRNLSGTLTPIETALAENLAPGSSITLMLESDERVTGHEKMTSAAFLKRLGVPSAVERLRDLSYCANATILSVSHAGSVITLTDPDSDNIADHAFVVDSSAAQFDPAPVALTASQARALYLARENVLVTPSQATRSFLESNPHAWAIEPSVITALRHLGLIHCIYLRDRHGNTCLPGLYVATGSERSCTFLREKLDQASRRRPNQSIC